MSDAGGKGEKGERPRHPIGVVSERTGLTPDVIRVWERRYGVVEPARESTGHRLYTDGDVARLELLARAVEGGRSIGRIAGLSEDEVAELVRTDAAARWRAARPPTPLPGGGGGGGGGSGPEVTGALVEGALERTRALDAAGLEAVLKRALMVVGVRVFLEHVVAPLLRRVGDAWHAGRLGAAHEHLASGVTVAVVAGLRSRLAAVPGAPLVAVGTPAGERHEVGALLAAAVAAAEGWRVLYLGPDLPAAELAGAADAAGARALALSVVRKGEDPEVTREISAVAESLRGRTDVLVGGAGVEALRPSLEGSGVVLLEGLDGFEAYLRGGRGPG